MVAVAAMADRTSGAWTVPAWLSQARDDVTATLRLLPTDGDRRLRKIEGQVRGLQKMIEADTWCPDVVTQVASATRALQEVAVGLLNDHLRHCVSSEAGKSEADSDRLLAEVAGTIRQVIRL